MVCTHRVETPNGRRKTIGPRMDTNAHESERAVQRSERKSAIDCSAVRQNAWNSAVSLWARRYAASTGRLYGGASPSNTSASKKPRMEQTESSDPLTKARFSATPQLSR